MLRKKNYIIPSLALLSVTALFLHGRVSQNLSYHNFADQRTIFRIANFLNVVTNLPFALIGVVGLRKSRKLPEKKVKNIFSAVFIGFLLLTLGSGYYHFSPNNHSLVYDRLPITMVLMSFFSFIVYDCVDSQKGYTALFVLNSIGILSVVYWIMTEQAGKGDVRWYGLVQFFPLIGIPLIIWLYKPTFHCTKEIVWMFLFFGLAKLTESFDKEIYIALHQLISGHSLKHLLMATAGYKITLLVMKIRRQNH